MSTSNKFIAKPEQIKIFKQLQNLPENKVNLTWTLFPPNNLLPDMF